LQYTVRPVYRQAGSHRHSELEDEDEYEKPPRDAKTLFEEDSDYDSDAESQPSGEKVKGPRQWIGYKFYNTDASEFGDCENSLASRMEEDFGWGEAYGNVTWVNKERHIEPSIAYITVFVFCLG
jgi:hypothetical protein